MLVVFYFLKRPEGYTRNCLPSSSEPFAARAFSTVSNKNFTFIFEFDEAKSSRLAFFVFNDLNQLNVSEMFKVLTKLQLGSVPINIGHSNSIVFIYLKIGNLGFNVLCMSFSALFELSLISISGRLGLNYLQGALFEGQIVLVDNLLRIFLGF